MSERNKCLECGKPSDYHYIKEWKKYGKDGEIGGWDCIEGDDIELYLCKEHAKEFDTDTVFRESVIDKLSYPPRKKNH